MLSVSAYIPCFNNEETIQQTIKSVQLQNFVPKEIFVIDDGSEDNSINLAKKAGVRVVENKENKGRGWIRNQAMIISRYEYVLCVDAGKKIESDFLEKGLKWFKNNNVAAVFGSLNQKKPRTAAERWRGIYLYNERIQIPIIQEDPPFITFAAIVRKSNIMRTGNYNIKYTHTEDLELGNRLKKAGFKIISDARLRCLTIKSCTTSEILNRYWRWNLGEKEELSLSGYIKKINYSLKEMVYYDIKDRDWKRAIISLLSPHYEFWKTVIKKIKIENR